MINRQGSPRRIWIAAVLSLAALAATLVPVSTAKAISSSDFNPGNIISDALFYDGNSLSASEIQSFLDAKMPRCTIGDPGREAGSSHGSNVVASSCLKSFRMSTDSRASNAYCGAYSGRTNETASEIVSRVGQACGISQKVLLVMLEKEQSLVSDTWPFARQFNVAMGYACPDSGPNNSANCDATYFGFFNQVYRAAWQLKVYKANPASFRYKPFQHNSIQWHPNTGCGSSQVYIENWATAALYIYTPYRPNQAALSAGWGTGDSCSTYGNRNFFLFYTSWFGSTQKSSHSNLDSIAGKYQGIEVIGWARRLSEPDRFGTAYVWVNLYNSEGTLVLSKPIAANQPLPWFNSQFPGWGPNHGFQEVIPAAPGTYRIELLNSSVNSELISSNTVSVPAGQGHLDSLEQVVGGIRAKGWSVDFRVSSADSLRVVLDGQEIEQQFKADRPTDWIGSMFPGAGPDHGFDFVIPTTLGAHHVCVYGAAGLLGSCQQLTTSSVDLGNLDTVTAAESGIRVQGWAFNLASAQSTNPAVTVNGKRFTLKASDSLDWFDSYFVGAGKKHGFNTVIPMEGSGPFEVCLFGEASGAKHNCISQNLMLGEATSFDSATVQPGQITASGWSAVFGKQDSNYVWINVDGVGSAYLADQPVDWFEKFSPGSGLNHGFKAKIKAATGMHDVCVFAAASGKIASCKRVNVPPPRELGYLDGIEVGSAGVRVYGWSQMEGQRSPSYIWIDVDGKGTAYPSSAELSWFDSVFPGQGNSHGYDITLPLPPGSHRICVSGASTPVSYGCQTVAVP